MYDLIPIKKTACIIEDQPIAWWFVLLAGLDKKARSSKLEMR